MIYQRGTRGSYDYWASEVDDPSYKWENMRQYFDRSVHFNLPNSSFRATNASLDYQIADSLQNGGPLEVAWPNFAMPFSSWGLKALFAGGMPHSEGFFSDGDLYGAAYNVRDRLTLRIASVERCTDRLYSPLPSTRHSRLDLRRRSFSKDR